MKTISKNHIVSELIRIDVKPGMELEVHSSLKSFSFVDRGAETVIDALKDVVGANGSIFMPALRLSQDLPLSEEDKKNGLLRKIKILSPEEKHSAMGIIADTFRLLPDTQIGEGTFAISVCGKNADKVNTGLQYLIDNGGKALLLGVDIYSLTAMHYVENNMPKIYKGHEVSCHTSTHPTISRSPIVHVTKKLIEDREKLEEIVGYTVRGLSYPNGSFSNEIKTMLPRIGIEYARVVDTTGNFEMPRDFLEWKDTCRHADSNLLKYADDFLALPKKQYLYMFYVWGHSYEFPKDNNWNVIEEFCEKIGNRDDIWYATNIEIVDYLKAYDNLQFSMNGDFVYNPYFQ